MLDIEKKSMDDTEYFCIFIAITPHNICSSDGLRERLLGSIDNAIVVNNRLPSREIFLIGSE